MNKALDSLIELTRLQSEINKLFEQLFGTYEMTEGAEQTWYPNIDLIETPTSIQIIAELPGVSKNEIKICTEGNFLVIQGFKRKDKYKYKDMKILRIEREYGPFYKAIYIPAAINPWKGKAYFSNGILKIIIPKIEDKRAKKVEIMITE